MIQSKEAVTPEMIEAVKILRLRAAGGYVSSTQAEAAFKILDDEGFFDLVDEAAGRPLPTEEEITEGRKSQATYERWANGFI